MGRMLLDVVEEHLDEASWQWLQRSRALMAPDFDLVETAVVEERLLAHVDGLVEAGSAAVDAFLAPALAPDDPCRVSAAALALLEGGEAGRALLLEEWLGTPELRPLLGAPLELAECPDLDARLGMLLETAPPELLADVVGVLAIRGALPSHLVDGLAVEPMRRRHMLARELALRTRGACLVRTRARVGRQRAMLREAASMRVAVRLQSPPGPGCRPC